MPDFRFRRVHGTLIEPVASELDDILAAFSALVAEHEANTVEAEEEDPENFRCTDCVDCRACRFCTACERCSDCTYCDACSDCVDCTQSRECIACAECSQSNLSAYCERSSYLTLCLDCEGCVQCFACVGMSDAEFCILNEKYKRSAYFKKVAELRMLLDAKLTEGWMPPWAEEVAASPEPIEEPDTTEPLEVLQVPEPPDVPDDLPSKDIVTADVIVPPEAPQRAAATDVTAPPVPEHASPPQLSAPPEREGPRGSARAGTDGPMDPIAYEPVATIAPEPQTEPVSLDDLQHERPPRFDPYTDSTASLRPVRRASSEHTGSWPPADHHQARSMDQEGGSESWEDLFAPDELPPPRPRPASKPDPAAPAPEPKAEAKAKPTSRFDTPPEAPEPAPAAAPKTGSRFGGGSNPSPRFANPSAKPSAPAPDRDPSEGPPPGFLGELPQAPEPSTDPESTGGLLRAKRPRRRDS